MRPPRGKGGVLSKVERATCGEDAKPRPRWGPATVKGTSYTAWCCCLSLPATGGVQRRRHRLPVSPSPKRAAQQWFLRCRRTSQHTNRKIPRHASFRDQFDLHKTDIQTARPVNLCPCFASVLRVSEPEANLFGDPIRSHFEEQRIRAHATQRVGKCSVFGLQTTTSAVCRFSSSWRPPRCAQN